MQNRTVKYSATITIYDFYLFDETFFSDKDVGCCNNKCLIIITQMIIKKKTSVSMDIL